MAKISFTLKNITKEIEKSEKKLNAIRKKVVKTDQSKIDLQLRALKQCHRTVKNFCRPTTLFAQSFTSKSK
jgi:Mg2+ and Co2+ transporter CorA